MSIESISLFDVALLKSIDFEDTEGISFSPSISPEDAGENLIMRPLCREDYSKGYFKLLRQLTVAEDVSQQRFEEQFDSMLASPETYYIFVIEDTNTQQVISSCSVLIERKFIRSCALRARIEDVVVDEAYRGRQLGKLILLTAKKLSQKLGCYKLSLDCADDKIPFYSKFGLKDGVCNFMVMKF